MLQEESLMSLEEEETTNFVYTQCPLAWAFVLGYNLLMQIYSFQIKDYDVDMTFNEGFVAYTFQRMNKKTKEMESYGIKVQPPSNDPIDMFAAAVQLTINAYETIEALDKPKRKKTNDK